MRSLRVSAVFAPWCSLPMNDEALPSFRLDEPANLGIATSEAGNVLLRLRGDALPRVPPPEMPSWLVHCVADVSCLKLPLGKCARVPRVPMLALSHSLWPSVVQGQYSSRDSVKLSFLLAPHEKSHLPELPPGANRLSAPRALKVSRVAAHVERTLAQGGSWQSDEGREPIQLFCGDRPLLPDVRVSLPSRLIPIPSSLNVPISL